MFCTFQLSWLWCEYRKKVFSCMFVDVQVFDRSVRVRKCAMDLCKLKLNNKYLIMPLWLTNRSPSLNRETPADCEGTWLTADSDMDVCRCFCVSLDKLGALRGSGVRSASAPQDPLLHLLLCSHTWSTWQTRCHAPENTPWFKRED